MKKRKNSRSFSFEERKRARETKAEKQQKDDETSITLYDLDVGANVEIETSERVDDDESLATEVAQNQYGGAVTTRRQAAQQAKAVEMAAAEGPSVNIDEAPPLSPPLPSPPLPSTSPHT